MNVAPLLTQLETLMRGYYNTLRGKLEAVFTGVEGHVLSTENPHQVTKTQVGLSRVQNFPVATETQALEGTDHSSYMTPRRTAQAIAALGLDNAAFEEIADLFDAAAEELE